MATAARLPLAAWRNEVCLRTIKFVGIDLTGVDMRAQVRLRPDAPGAPLIALETVLTAASQGLKLDGVSVAGGVPTSTVIFRINKTTMQDPAKVPYGGEAGSDTALSYAIQLGGTSIGATRVYGPFIVLANVMDSEGAPVGASSGYGNASSGMLPWSAAQVTFSDDDITISIDGIDLLAPLVVRATDAATAAEGFADAAAETVDGFDLHAVQVGAAFDAHAGAVTSTFDANASTKTTTFNTNASDKTSAFNDVVTAANTAIDGKVAIATTQAVNAAASAASANLPATLVSVIGKLAPLTAATSVDASGWSANFPAPVDLSLAQFKVLRQGFDASGNASAIVDTFYATKRVRQVYPNQASFTATGVALSDYVFSTDATLGVVNHSTEVSPKPVAAWVMPSRMAVGNTVDWEMVAFHMCARAGRQVACVRVRANNGTTQTPWQIVSATAISTSVEDAQPVEVYKGTLDITALATGLFWLEAEVLPWIGTTASVLRSEDQSDPREFYRRYFTKNVALATTPPLVYVSPAGNNGTGVCSTNPATASASPFADVQSAITGAIANAAVSGGKVDGLRVRIMAGTNIWGSFNAAINRTQNSAAMIIERDPSSPRASCILQQSTALSLKIGFATSTTSSLTSPLTEASTIFRDLTYQRTAAGQIGSGGAAVQSDIQIWNVAWDNGSLLGSWLGNTGGLRFYGGTITNVSTFFVYSPTAVQRLHRGFTTSNPGPFERWVQVGCKLTGFSGGTNRDPTKGMIVYGNSFPSPATTQVPIGIAATSASNTITGVVVVQNLVEATHNVTSAAALRLSGDGENGSIVHAVVQHNTITGYGVAGRQNLFYDESSGTNRRNHRLIRCTGNIFVQLNTKGDVFVAASQSNPTEAPFRTGQLAFSHGVGNQGNWSMFATQAPPSEAQVYPGPGSNIGSSSSVRNDPLFVDYQGTGGSGGTPVVGAGNGDYHLQVGSPARGIVTVPTLGFDFAGSARGVGAQAAGVYA